MGAPKRVSSVGPTGSLLFSVRCLREVTPPQLRETTADSLDVSSFNGKHATRHAHGNQRVLGAASHLRRKNPGRLVNNKARQPTTLPRLAASPATSGAITPPSVSD